MMHNPWDLIATGEELYISEQGLSYIHNVNLDGRHEDRHWNATGQAANLSMTPSGNILASHLSTNNIVEYTPIGIVVREIYLGIRKIAPSHAVQLRSGLYVVCDIMSEQHRVVKLDKSGQVIKEYKVASKLEKKTLLRDEQDNILVADQDNDRILWMSSSLKVTKELAIPVGIPEKPNRMCLDQDYGKLYVAEEKQKRILVCMFKSSH